ncbi:hypothetical protein ATANTOWER_022445 [Ataeniobius toweri]|uniref:Uncharacterized protein n=1 Tax=Ataeniobius toweri TaxID=208326 RepID=A0ABU7CI05_9TELE|nr:hypothetical protein [Ataeniobius toweri]
MYTSSTSSTDIIVRHTILHFCQESIVYPEKNVPSGQEGSPLPCVPIEKIRSIALRDHLTRSIIHNSGDMQREAPKENKTQSRSRADRVRETGENHPPPPRAQTLLSNNLRCTALN